MFPNASELRRWFEANHEHVREAWIGYYRKGVGKASVRYPEAVDEALCFGWIDGLTYRVDDEVHTNRFTPRRRGSTWSTVNVRRMGELIAAGRAHPAGIAAFEARVASAP